MGFSIVSEATIAKRRSYATLISYNSPPYTTADLYEDYAKIEELVEEYREALDKDISRAQIAKSKILNLAEQLNLEPDIDKIESKIYEYKRSIIPKGLHVIGKNYDIQDLKDFIFLLSRYDRGEAKSLTKLIAEKKSLSFEKVIENVKLMKSIEKEAKTIIDKFIDSKKVDKEYEKLLNNYIEFAKNFANNSPEIDNLIKALSSAYIEPSSGGDVIRNPEALPTGRNLYQFDPLKVPSESAVERGRKIAQETISKYIKKHGKYPESVALVLWGFETAQTYGDTVAQIFELIGVEVIHKTAWEKELRIKSLEELGRPRIDVVVTICGFFREMFPNVIELIDKAIERVSKLDESEELNFVKKHSKELNSNLRIFGPRSTEYGTRMLALVEDSIWQTESDLASAYLNSMCYAYGKETYGTEAKVTLENLLKTVDIVSQVRSSVDYEITDLDHYYEFFGGLAKTVELLKGNKAEMVIADSTKEIVKVESIEDAIERGTITRTLNPKWINEMLKHGFLGVQKIADRIEYLLGLAATTHAVSGWIWNKITERYILDEQVFDKIKKLNIFATQEILKRLLEAEKRGYWQAGELKQKIEEKYLEIESEVEAVTE